MDTQLDLISMPMHDPLQPSCQLGVLHAYVERAFGERVPVRSRSAYLEILLEVQEDGLTEFFARHRLFGEELFFLVCCHGLPEARPRFERAFQRYNATHDASLQVDRDLVARLASAIERYLDERVVPELSPDRLNVVGLSTTFTQVFASIYAAHHLRRRAPGPLLLVFGGASMALPEADAVLERWGVDGLIVRGSGEGPLAELLEACLALAPADAGRSAEVIGSAGLVNVSRIGGAKAIDLRLSKAFVEALPDPMYDEYFATLRAHCEDEATYEATVSALVSIPLEGSRGCFARCDFCQNPDITSQFRTLTGRTVAGRALALCARHRRRKVYFADSVCNSWAEDYADHLLAEGASIEAFMEMRVHAPEPFWTKLALAGVSEIQLGIEAISQGLLSAMRKGTTVMQNLAAAKYLCELGVRSASNLITHHPKSTVADVEETARIVELVPHFPEFSLSRFVVSYASPIYKELDETRRGELVRGFGWLPRDLRELSLPRDLAYPYPVAWLDPGVARAWDDFRRWYGERRRAPESPEPRLEVVARPGGLEVLDHRGASARRFALQGDGALVFASCHRPSSAAQVVERTGLTDSTVDRWLGDLVEEGLLVRVGEQHLNLALRPRAELIANLSRPGARRSAPRRLPVLTTSSSAEKNR